VEPTAKIGGTSESALSNIKSKLIQNSMMEISREETINNGKVGVGKIIQNSSGGNTLFLDLGIKTYSSNNDDYGTQNKTSSPQIEIDGKKVNILKNHNDRQDERMMITDD